MICSASSSNEESVRSRFLVHLKLSAHSTKKSLISMLNSLCNTVKPVIALENHRMAAESKAKAAGEPANKP